MPANKPRTLTVNTYNVGFGDCFMLTFEYTSRKRHILIDFGMQRKPVNPKPNHMGKIARQIAEDCEGKLDVIVATHRHQDHISGFSTNNSGTAPGDIIARLKPSVVVQPWTEHPMAPTDAEVAPSRETRLAHRRKLNKLHEVAASIPAQLRGLRGISNATRERLEFLGQNNIKNELAVRNLMKMARKPNKGSYVHTGSASGFGHLLPGVKVHVLGPPTLVQTESIKQQTNDHSEEFWQLQSALNTDGEKKADLLFPNAVKGGSPANVRWIVHRLNQLRAEELLQIVRILDDAMNNTSVILLFECGSKSFLFPGDAQWENWAYALGQEKYRKLVRNIDLYKVGHHGSLNATPRSLWKLFRQRGSAHKKNRLESLLSTKGGVHGHEDRNSEVPRRTLVSELRKKSNLTTTEDFGSDLVESSVFTF